MSHSGKKFFLVGYASKQITQRALALFSLVYNDNEWFELAKHSTMSKMRFGTCYGYNSIVSLVVLQLSRQRRELFQSTRRLSHNSAVLRKDGRLRHG